MAVSLDALLKIRADVQGEGAIAKLGGAIGGVRKTADATSGVMQKLTGAVGMGGLAGAMGALTPLLSAAGLTAMAKGAIDAADNMNDLRQKTGVSVPVLSRFGRAAEMSGTNIDNVAAAMAKMAKGMLANKGPALDAMRELGISSRDAAGKIKGVDTVMLEVADKFKAMPDGAGKTALALKLFGKAGADMIPMLNMGSKAIKELGVTMTDEFAAQADELNDKFAGIQASFTRVAVQLATALMPTLDALANVVGALATGLGQLPGPLQTLFVTGALIAIAWGPIVAVFTGLVAVLGAVGPALTAIGAIAAGLVSWPVLLVAALIAAGVALFVFRDQIGAFFKWWWETSRDILNAIGGMFNTLLFQPFVKSWENIGIAAQVGWKMLTDGWQKFSTWIRGVFTAIGKFFSDVFVGPVTKAFTFLVDAGKTALRGLLSWAANAINGVINLINRMISGLNMARAALRMGPLPFLAQVGVPAFAAGGFVTQPTVGLLGDNRSGREYAVPEEKVLGFASNIMAGARGAAAIPSSTSSSGAAAGPVTVNLTTGPLQQLPDGRGGLAIEDVERLVRQGVSETIRQLRTPAGRYATGMR